MNNTVEARLNLSYKKDLTQSEKLLLLEGTGQSTMSNEINQSTMYLTEQNMCSSVGERKVTLAEAIACAVSILTVLENIVILAAITRGPKSLRKPPYWFIASLAAADLLTGVEVVMAIFIPVGSSPSSRIVLKGIAVVTFIVSINSLLLVSFDRYLRIAHHADYERFLTRRMIVFLIAGSWIVSFGLFLIAPLLGWSCASMHCCAVDGLCVCKRSLYGNFACNAKCSQSFVPFTKIYLLVGVAYFVISIIAMIGFYAALFRVVKKKTFGHHRGSGSSCTGDSKSKKREMQLAKTLIITLGIFIICWLPLMVLFVADFIITTPTDGLAKAFDYVLVPSVINSFSNPIIYSIRLPRMRNTVKQLLLPCVYGSGKRGYLGSTWATNTSMDRSIRRKSIRKRIEKLRDGPTGSSNGSSKSTTNNRRSRLVSAKSLNSEVSYSGQSSNSIQKT